MNETIKRSQIHATFVIDRTYPVPVEAVWHALSDNDARDQWFGAGSAFRADEKSHPGRQPSLPGIGGASGWARRGTGLS